MRVLHALIAVVVAMTLLGACGGDDEDKTDASGKTTTSSAAAEANPSSADHVFTGADDQGDVSVAAGETFDVVLETCPSCGYHWELIKGDEPNLFGATDTVQFLSDETVPRPADPGIVGGPADYFAHFKANTSGGVNIQLGYIPPGETEPEESVIISVTVTE